MRTVFGALALLAAAANAKTIGSVVLQSGGALKYVEGSHEPNAIAIGTFVDQDENKQESGFGQLTISTSSSPTGATDALQFRAAGLLEGSLTAVRMEQHMHNTFEWIDSNFHNHTVPPAFETWFKTQDAFARGNVAGNKGVPRWETVGLVLEQLDGLLEGYNGQAKEKRTMYEMQLFQALGDLLDLIPAIGDSADVPDWEHMPRDEVLTAMRKRSHCSGLVRVTGDLSDILISHVAWFTYGAMLRVWKTYDFDVAALPGRRSAFSSYPGLLSSLDDFYLYGSSNMAMVQTTNNVFNKELYSLVKPESLLAWQRVRAAGLLADSGEQWAVIAGASNSGSYNNGYMVINLKLFTPGKPLVPGTLHYCEQIPGQFMHEDVTGTLERGYWPSYNVPYFPEIYNASGYPQLAARFVAAGEPVEGLDYQLAPRAQLFRRDNGKAMDLETLQSLMRSNNYRTDPYAHDNPWAAICSRGDLAANGSPDGCIDGKAATAAMVSELRATVVNGPTTNGGTLPPFQWTSAFNNTAHVGQFDEFDFSWQEMKPTL